MSVTILRGNALDLPLADDTVDLVVTSPPYFGLRSYTDGGEHYDGQVGAEATPAEFVDALIAATREMVRVVKPTGSIFVNLGDRYSSGNSGQSGLAQWSAEHARGGAHREAPAKRRSAGTDGYPPKSLLGLPWRYANRVVDELGLILRAEIVWSKPNGLPESVRDRVRRSHEQWFHFTLRPTYYANVDEVREPHAGKFLSSGARNPRYGRDGGQMPGRAAGVGERRDDALGRRNNGNDFTAPLNRLGKLPGSVWTIATQPLRVPAELGVDHFAAFPMEWPRRIITGWSPPGICTACGEGRRAVVDSQRTFDGEPIRGARYSDPAGKLIRTTGSGIDNNRYGTQRTLTGYACACPTPDAPTRPAVVLDPFGGTGTTALVADVLGRDAVHVDLSSDYCRLAQWRTTDPKQRARAARGPSTKAPAPAGPSHPYVTRRTARGRDSDPAPHTPEPEATLFDLDGEAS